MEWIYFSPHLDDVALSCGGLVWEQSRRGVPVQIWTVCAGDPPPGQLSPFAQALHHRWQVGAEAVELRRQEDAAACAALGAVYRHLQVPDCIYRRSAVTGEAVYASESDIFGEVHAQEAVLIDSLVAELSAALPQVATFVCPLTLGGHVDHKLTRLALEKLIAAMPEGRHWDAWYYADYPYARSKAQTLMSMQRSLAWNLQRYPVTADGMLAWERAVAAYASQISTFWQDLEAMREDLRSFAQQAGGVCLWQPCNLHKEQTF